MQDTKLNANQKAAHIAIAAALALTLGAAPLAGCTSGSTNTNSTNTSQQSDQQADSQQAPEGQQGEAAGDGNTPPEPPDGESASGEQGGTPPDMPEGEQGATPPDGDGGTPPAKPGESSDSSEGGNGGTPPEMPSGENGQGGAPGGGAADTMSFDFSGSYSGALSADGQEVTSDGETVDASEVDQNAALATNGGTLTITGDTLTKSGDDTNGDNCNFYGLNSIALAVGEGSQVILSETSLEAVSEGSNGIFATDSGTAWANDVDIATTASNSRGLDATYGGTIVANELTVSTQGDHCASVATDRGGGNISVTNSTLETAGSGSPVLYSTGLIEVDNVKGTATGSQLVGMEGLNTVMISNSTLESTQTGKTASDPVADAVIIYQSTSGDAEATTGDAALFQASDSTLTSAIDSGAFFYLTNTDANVVLSNTTLDYDSTAAKLLLAQGNSSNNWGSSGSNGATLTFTGIDQQLEGDIEVDTISSVDLYLLEGSTWNGSAEIVENADGGTALDENLNVNVDATSTWVVTADTTVDNLNVAEGGSVVDSDGKTVRVVDASGSELVAGESSITVTVNGAYSTTVTTDDSSALQTASVDRSEFDQYFGTSTEFGTNGGDQQADAEESASTGNPFLDFWNWLMGLFGIK